MTRISPEAEMRWILKKKHEAKRRREKRYQELREMYGFDRGDNG